MVPPQDGLSRLNSIIPLLVVIPTEYSMVLQLGRLNKTKKKQVHLSVRSYRPVSGSQTAMDGFFQNRLSCLHAIIPQSMLPHENELTFWCSLRRLQIICTYLLSPQAWIAALQTSNARTQSYREEINAQFLLPVNTALQSETLCMGALMRGLLGK